MEIRAAIQDETLVAHAHRRDDRIHLERIPSLCASERNHPRAVRIVVPFNAIVAVDQLGFFGVVNRVKYRKQPTVIAPQAEVGERVKLVIQIVMTARRQHPLRRRPLQQILALQAIDRPFRNPTIRLSRVVSRKPLVAGRIARFGCVVPAAIDHITRPFLIIGERQHIPAPDQAHRIGWLLRPGYPVAGVSDAQTQRMGMRNRAALGNVDVQLLRQISHLVAALRIRIGWIAYH